MNSGSAAEFRMTTITTSFQTDGKEALNPQNGIDQGEKTSQSLVFFLFLNLFIVDTLFLLASLKFFMLERGKRNGFQRFAQNEWCGLSCVLRACYYIWSMDRV